MIWLEIFANGLPSLVYGGYPCINRGGYYKSAGVDGKTAGRARYNTSYSDIVIGFRTALYL